MIRFIDIRDQDTGFKFAFFDTITNGFLSLGGDQVWRSKRDFIEGATGDPLFQRCLAFVPDWKDDDDDE